MHPTVYKQFEKILQKYEVNGKVLEVGAVPNKRSLLASITLGGGCEKVGINLVGSKKISDFKIVEGNANNMDMFKNQTFDCVLCNAVLEHDKYFWKSVFEMKRVLKKGGLLIIGTPSYTNLRFNRITIFITGRNPISDFLRNVTFCFRIHDAPGDYYRFSEQTFKEVFFAGFKNVTIKTIMLPPRTIGYGFKK